MPILLLLLLPAALIGGFILYEKAQSSSSYSGATNPNAPAASPGSQPASTSQSPPGSGDNPGATPPAGTQPVATTIPTMTNAQVTGSLYAIDLTDPNFSPPDGGYGLVAGDGLQVTFPYDPTANMDNQTGIGYVISVTGGALGVNPTLSTISADATTSTVTFVAQPPPVGTSWSADMWISGEDFSNYGQYSPVGPHISVTVTSG